MDRIPAEPTSRAGSCPSLRSLRGLMTAGSLSCEALAGLAAVTVATFRVAPRTPTPALAACMKRGQGRKYRDLVRRITRPVDPPRPRSAPRIRFHSPECAVRPPPSLSAFPPPSRQPEAASRTFSTTRSGSSSAPNTCVASRISIPTSVSPGPIFRATSSFSLSVRHS